MLLVVHLIMIVVLILLGILFHFGKGADLIAGYNTLPAEKKAEYDVKKLCKYMSKLMLALAVCWMVIASSELFKTMALLWIGLCLFMLVVLFGVIYMNTGNRFKK